MTSNSASLYITQIRFCRALAVVRSLPTESGGIFQPSTADKLNFYGLYKQALVGDCMLLKPSQRNIVQYAKWKTWDKLRGVSPIDAQIMYIQALINLLKEFLIQYPNSELTDSINESVRYLEETEETTSHEENLVQWDTNDQEKEEFYLGHIEQDQILADMQSYYSSPITTEFPITPELSPRNHLSKNNSFTTKKSISSSTSSLKQHHNYYQSIEEMDDEFDKEVATITNSVNKKHHSKRSNSNAAIKTLQLEVQALCEEIDQLRRKDVIKTSSILKWRSLWFFKSVAKHAFFNILILMLLFIVLWRRKSPIAYAVVGYAGPRFRDLLRYLFNHVVYWKVTV